MNDPDDPGGETKYGISKRTYPKLDIKNLTEQQAKDIYYTDWYVPLHLNEIKDLRIAAKVLDTCVNVGKKPGMRIFQQSLRERGHNVTVNGIVSGATIEAANRANPEKLLGVLQGRQAAYYRSLIVANPTLAKYAVGWMKRAYS